MKRALKEEGPLVVRMLRGGVCAVLLALVALAVLWAVSSNALADDVTWGDKVVTGAEQYSWTNVTLDGNLTVADGGSLVLEEGLLLVNATECHTTSGGSSRCRSSKYPMMLMLAVSGTSHVYLCLYSTSS